MRLASIYIPKNTLPHLFGENHIEYTLNLGGQNNYSFKETNADIKISKLSTNENIIEDFWGNGISLITSIVGKNAVGKSSVLRALNHSIDPRSKKLVYLVETSNTNEFQIINETENTISNDFKAKFNIVTNKIFETLYYSPNLDYDIIDTFSPITLINYFDDNFENYFLDSVSRNVTFLSDPLIENIKKVYNDFPNYDFIKVNVKKTKKSKFRTPYLESNFGNPHRGDALKNELSGELMRLKDETFPKENFTKEEIIKSHENSIRLLESESFTEQFNKLWDLDDYKYSDDSGYDYIHNSSDFIKNIEVNILSYLLLGATFAKTGLGGGLNFSDIINTKNFQERINFLLEMYLVNEHENITNKIRTELKNVKIENSINIITIIKKHSLQKELGVDIKSIQDRMIRYVESFKDIYTFYKKLIILTKSVSIKSEEGQVIFDVKNRESKLLFDELVFNYKYILQAFPKCPINISLFDFSPNNKLSTGEKAILDFYSSVYNYIDTSKESDHLNHPYYLLLLDEPDLGFHPLWKKKFINAISKTLPIIFSKINPVKYDQDTKKYISIRGNPIIQIIFSTHDPLTLSDIPNSNIIYLDKNGGSSLIIGEIDRPTKSFGANITDLLADSFFIDDGLIGEFALEKIETTINWINEQKKRKDKEQIKYIVDEAEYKHHKKIISIIDEHVIRLKLAEMLEELKGEKKLQEELIDEEIKYLQFKKGKL
jgi:energy-coupling factor transporter ATP-binding protein EcfA2